jgi:hypothetical protein
VWLYLLCLPYLLQLPASGDTLDIQIGSRFIIEDGGASIRQFPFVYTFDNDAFVFFSEHGDSPTVHNVDGMRLSREGGANWPGYCQTNDFYLASLVRLEDGTLWGMSYVTEWIDSTNCSCFFQTSTNNGDTWTLHTGKVAFPKPAKGFGVSSYGGFLFHRNMLLMGDGSLQGPMYGYYATDTKYRSVWAKSTDGGANWSFVSTIAQDNAIGSEGYCEPVVERCRDGSLLCVMRVDSTSYPLYQNRSTNDGLSWSTPTTLPGVNPDTTYSVDPDLCLMSNGVLALSYGRPDNKLLFSADGKGETWGYYRNIYSGKSSGYTGIRETSSGRLLMVGDEGANWQSPGAYRIWGVFVDVTPPMPVPEGKLDLASKYGLGHISVDTDMTWTSPSYPKVGVAAAFDGNTDYWHSAFKGSAKLPSYYTITLDVLYTFAGLGTCLKPGYTESADIYFSTNGVDWGRPVKSYTNANLSAVDYTTFAEAIPARYVKVEISAASGWPGLNEIELFPADQDSDGIPDTLDTDDDNDGMTDADENIAGTDPFDPLSYFKVSDVSLLNPGFRLSFQTLTNRFYAVESCPDLISNQWDILINRMPGIGGLAEFDDSQDWPKRFYRIKVER